MNEQNVEYLSAGGTFAGFLVAPSDAPSPRPAVLHGGAGLRDHERDVARRLAALGYVAFAPDLFGEVFETRARGVEVITKLVDEPAVLRARLGDALSFASSLPEVDSSRLAAIGFCFGGLAALELARSGADVRAVVSFHGGLTARESARSGEVRASILACTGAADPFVTREHRAAFEDEMTAANADWQLQTYAGAMHAFTVREATAMPGCAYQELAARRSWGAMRAVLKEAFESR
jgi:dienelactone hydrolase